MFSYHLIHIIIPALHIVYDLYLKKTPTPDVTKED